MLKIHEFWTLTVAGSIAILLALANMYLFQGNRALQAEVNTRAQYIQQSIALESLYREMVQGLADRAVRTRDDQIRDLLSAEGINVTFDAAGGGAATREEQR